MSLQPKSELEDKLERIEEEQQDQKNQFLSSSQEKDDDTRQSVAKNFVKWYFWILLLIIVGIPLYNYFSYRMTGNSDLVIAPKDAILTYSAVVGPTLGLVIAYYFKSNSK